MGPEPGVGQNGDDDDADAEDGVEREGRRDEADEKLPEGRGRPRQFESKVQINPFYYPLPRKSRLGEHVVYVMLIIIRKPLRLFQRR